MPDRRKGRSHATVATAAGRARRRVGAVGLIFFRDERLLVKEVKMTDGPTHYFAALGRSFHFSVLKGLGGGTRLIVSGPSLISRVSSVSKAGKAASTAI